MEKKKNIKINPKDNDIILQEKKLSTLLGGTTSKCHVDFYCLNCFQTVRTENKLKPHEKVWKNKDFCGILIQSDKG